MKAFEIWVGIVLMIILTTLIIFVKVVKDERTQCIKDPLVYGVKNIQESSDYPFMCECGLLDKYNSRILITKDGYKPIVVSNPNAYIPFNLSNIDEAITNGK